jgi:hypothetical protein
MGQNTVVEKANARKGLTLRRGSQNLAAGLFCLAFGGLCLYLLWDHPMMRGSRVGTGYFPKILVLLILAMSVTLIIRGLLGHGEGLTLDRPRPIIFVIGSFLVFAVLIRPVGFFFACMATVIVACWAEPGYKIREVALLSLILSGGATLLFIELIDIPVRVFPWNY